MDEFYGFIKSRKSYIFVIDSHLKDRTFTAIKRDERSKQGTRKGYHLSIQGIQKGYLFRKKWYMKG